MNKKELKEYVLKNHLTVNKAYMGEQCYMSNSFVSMSEQDFTDLIDQLDEPVEELSQQWIDNHLCHEDEYDFYYIDSDDLKQLFLLKPEKPEIPQFVADWIKRQLAYGYENVFIAMNRVMGGGSDRLINWFDLNPDTFARAWLDGYTVEKKRYYVVDKDGCAILKRNTDREFFKQVAYPENGKLKSYYIGDEDYMFTEKEIKDYDERYWPFAKKVKEDMEEK